MTDLYKPLPPTVTKSPSPKVLSGGMQGGHDISDVSISPSKFWGSQRPVTDTLASRKRATPVGVAASNKSISTSNISTTTRIKTSATELKDYQQRVVDKVTNPAGPHGIIAYHSMGSGKTLTSLGALAEALKSSPKARGLVIVPASLVNNYNEEIDRHGFKRIKNRLDILSYDRAANKSDELAKNHYALSVFDEAHRLRNTDTVRARQLRKVINESDKVLMLTGTVAYNNPVDMCNLINIANTDAKLPNAQTDFNNRYIDNVSWKVKNKAELAKLLSTYVDHYETPKDAGDFPEVERKVINVEMSPRQAAVYKSVEKDIP
jgi:SNF2 family DNA or RNA helicase